MKKKAKMTTPTVENRGYRQNACSYRVNVYEHDGAVNSSMVRALMPDAAINIALTKRKEAIRRKELESLEDSKNLEDSKSLEYNLAVIASSLASHEEIDLNEVLYVEVDNSTDMDQEPVLVERRPRSRSSSTGYVYRQGDQYFTIVKTPRDVVGRVSLQKTAPHTGKAFPENIEKFYYDMTARAVSDSGLERLVANIYGRSAGLKLPQSRTERLTDEEMRHQIELYHSGPRQKLTKLEYQQLPRWRKWLTTTHTWRALARLLKLVAFTKVLGQRRWPFFRLEIPQPPARVVRVYSDGRVEKIT